MKLSTAQACHAIAVGVGATAVMDLTAEIMKRTRGTRSLDYALLGRWLGHMPAGRFRHTSIADAAPVPHERALGWAAHYAIGSSFAVALALIDRRWLDDPRFVPAVSMGVVTVAAPWFLMQPAFGLGVAASRTPRPSQARAGSLRAHTAYGIGLWVSGAALARARRALTP